MRFIRVNMRTRTVSSDDVPKQYQGLGGRGLTSIMINNEVLPTCDPLGPDNKLIFAPGLLTGTRLVNTSRLSVGTKSPLTGGIKESNAGGTIGLALAKLGITAIIVEDQAPAGEYFILKIDEKGEVSITESSEFKGMRTYAFAEKMLTGHGEKTSILCIGPAGEQRLSSASIQATDTDGRPCRAAARGGVGAVMGSKGLKAILVAQGGKQADSLVDSEAFNSAAKTFAKSIQNHPFCGELLRDFGTAALVGIVNSMGGFPCYNATKGSMDTWQKISGEVLVENMKHRGGNPSHRGCSSCIVKCSNEYVDEAGKYITSSLEYETIWSLGGMTGIDDPDIIARLDYLCDDIGLDTMNTGVSVAVAMDAGYKSFGDGKATIEMIEEIAEGTEFGKLLGTSPDAVGAHLKHHRIPTVKNQSIAAYDPRALQGTGVTYATSPMGADHTAGNVIGEYFAGKLNPLSPEGQVEASRNAQIAMTLIDNAGLCLLVGPAMDDPEGALAFLKTINAKTGLNLSPDELIEVGIRILKAEREFNQKAGLKAEDDRLPEFFKEEPLSPHNVVFKVDDKDLDDTLVF